MTRHSRQTDRQPLVPGSELGLFTDLYELTMMQAYHEAGMHETAVFSLFVRRLPETSNFLLAAGMETVLEQLETLQFSQGDIDYLASLGHFDESFLGWLADLRFTGDVFAVPEGTPVFPNEPILEVVAPLPQAQLIETLVMNQIHLQTVLASKAARLALAAGKRPVVDFGARRMHGIDAAIKGAWAYHLAGIAGTSNMLAGREYGVPVLGTMAHSFIQACEDETTAFRRYARRYPQTVLLVDTYDTLDGIERVIELAREMGDDFTVRAVRLDSGDLGELARQARARLDEAALTEMEIIASGGLDEHEIKRLIESDAPIDAFGVGTSMGVSHDAPDLDIAYKLAEYAGVGRLKLSSGKPILPGRKQVFRRSEDGIFCGDVIGRHDEDQPGEPLLRHVMAGGRRTFPEPDLDDLREQARVAMERLPEAVRRIEPADPPYPVEISEQLRRHQDEVRQAAIERESRHRGPDRDPGGTS
ncbi:MAG: nicotinate phosphoribosyltransferase [Hyphomicrobiales bacterium]